MDHPLLMRMQKALAEAQPPGRCPFPATIGKTLGLTLTAAELGTVTMEMATDPSVHANPMGTIHGGVLCDLGDAAIGTAHSTTLQDGESFTSVDLQIKFFRPVWKDLLRAVAKPLQQGKTLSYYTCDIHNSAGKLVCTLNSTVMTLRGDKAAGR